MNQFNIAILVGTSREGRQSIHVAKLINSQAKTYKEFKPVLVDPAALNFPDDGQ